MRVLLTLMAAGIFAVSIGCAPEETATKPAAKPAENKPAEIAKVDDAGDKDTSEATKSDAGGEFQTVSLKLPGMTWGGCASSVRRALTSVDGISDIELDTKETCGSFKAPADLDVKAMLDKFVDDGNKHIKGWSMAE